MKLTIIVPKQLARTMETLMTRPPSLITSESKALPRAAEAPHHSGPVCWDSPNPSVYAGHKSYRH